VQAVKLRGEDANFLSKGTRKAGGGEGGERERDGYSVGSMDLLARKCVSCFVNSCFFQFIYTIQ
jgi:hypothetical protein